MVVLAIHAAVNDVCVWVRHNRMRDVGGIFWWNNYILPGGDSITRVCCIELSKGKDKSSVLKPGSNEAKPLLNINLRTEDSKYGAKKWAAFHAAIFSFMTGWV